MLNSAKPTTPAFVLDSSKVNNFFEFKGNSAKAHVKKAEKKRPQLGINRFVQR